MNKSKGISKSSKGSFWPAVRAKIWIKAEELFMQDQIRTWDCPTTPERSELREGGYFDRAKLIILREVQASGVC